jgi:hypothetical protein
VPHEGDRHPHGARRRARPRARPRRARRDDGRRRGRRGAGVAAGLALAAAGARIVGHLLYGSADADWIFYASAAAVVVCVGFVASIVPARRAAAVEPLTALRSE